MKTEKYGFVYIWYDKGLNRYYVGSHWGTENDGYVCSSTWMRNAFKHRPQDFTRRTISCISTNKWDLWAEEQRWLYMIPDNELGQKYYNRVNYVTGFAEGMSRQQKNKPRGPYSAEHCKSISDAKRAAFAAKKLAGRPCYEEQAMKNIKIGGKKNIGRKQPTEEIESRRQSNLAWWNSKEGKKRRKEINTNHMNTPEAIAKRIATLTGRTLPADHKAKAIGADRTDAQKAAAKKLWKAALPFQPIKRKTTSEKLQKTYFVTNLQGQQQTVTNLRQFCLQNNLHQANMLYKSCGSRGWKATKA